MIIFKLGTCNRNILLCKNFWNTILKHLSHLRNKECPILPSNVENYIRGKSCIMIFSRWNKFLFSLRSQICILAQTSVAQSSDRFVVYCIFRTNILGLDIAHSLCQTYFSLVRNITQDQSRLFHLYNDQKKLATWSSHELDVWLVQASSKFLLRWKTTRISIPLEF